VIAIARSLPFAQEWQRRTGSVQAELHMAAIRSVIWKARALRRHMQEVEPEALVHLIAEKV